MHIWWANLRDFDQDVHILNPLLSPAERERAGRFRFLRDKSNYIISHGILRVLLAGYVKESPSALNFAFGAHGKPELRQSPRGGKIYFNLSHSEDLALYGITRACPIGVDVEYLCPLSDLESIAQDILSKNEIESLMGLPGEHRSKYFFTLWTRKEALIKARGEGLADLQSIRTFFPAILDVSKYTAELPPVLDCVQWHVRSFIPARNYIGAVAFRNPDLNLTISQWPESPGHNIMQLSMTCA